MRLTTFTDYTLRVLMYLALNPERTATVAEIAEAYGISRLHLNKVVLELGQAGHIETTRGRNGGIRLAKPAAAINLADVVRCAEPDMELAPCFRSTRACVLARCCVLQGVLQRAIQAFFAELAPYTLSDLVGPGGPTLALFPAQQPPERPVNRGYTRRAGRRGAAAPTRTAAKAQQRI